MNMWESNMKYYLSRFDSYHSFEYIFILFVKFLSKNYLKFYTGWILDFRLNHTMVKEKKNNKSKWVNVGLCATILTGGWKDTIFWSWSKINDIQNYYTLLTIAIRMLIK